MDRAYPAKLQPDLIDRYFENSFTWHRFANVTESDPLTVEVDSDMDRALASSSQPASGYCCDVQEEGPAMVIEEVDLSDTDDNLKGTLRHSSLTKADTLLSLFKPTKRKQSTVLSAT